LNVVNLCEHLCGGLVAEISLMLRHLDLVNTVHPAGLTMHDRSQELTYIERALRGYLDWLDPKHSFWAIDL
jgi:hypothetical protein